MTYDLGIIKRQRYVPPTYAGLGGTISYYTINGISYTAHTFLGSGSFVAFSPITADCLVVGGGGGSANDSGAGGGGFRTTSTFFSVGTYAITVGNGGAVSSNGGASSIIGGSITFESAGGGTSGSGGGSGGGNGGLGNVPATVPPQGNDGGSDGFGGGGGGAAAAGSGRNGGAGAYNSYSGTSTPYAGGGGGGGSWSNSQASGPGGVGGGGDGSWGPGWGGTRGDGGINTGGGGGGVWWSDAPHATGGSGIIIIRYPTPQTSLIPPVDPYFKYVSLLLSNQGNSVSPIQSIYDASPTVEYIAVGGGGAGGQMIPSEINWFYGGGGGAGGVVCGTLTNTLISSSNIFVITVGAGGVGSLTLGAGNGYNSSIVNQLVWNFTTNSIIAYGGGQGGFGSFNNNGTNGVAGGSGGGGGGNYAPYGAKAGGSSSQTSLVDVSLGNAGGAGGTRVFTPSPAHAGGGGGGGGAVAAGAAGQTNYYGGGGDGGAGIAWLNGITYAAGGPGYPGGGPGANYTGNGGASGGLSTSPGPNGGGGIIILRYPGTNALASGGTVTTASNYTYHTFTASGVLSFTTASTTIASSMNYLLVGGGGAGGSNGGGGGGGGAGGLIKGTFTTTNLTSLLTINVGAGGANSSINGNYVNKIAYAGGRGGNGDPGGGTGQVGYSGGSGGGGGGSYARTGSAGGAATQASSESGGFGNAGGGLGSNSGGGGGAGGAGGANYVGGAGLFINTPSADYTKIYAAGATANSGVSGTGNTGNGGSGGYNGGSGVAILWEPAANPVPGILGSPTVITARGYRLYVFTSSGALILGPKQSNSKFIENSSNANIIYSNGTPAQGSFNPYSSNWSTYFNGTTDYLSIADNAALELTTGDFTVEAWFYATSAPNAAQVILNRRHSSGSTPYKFVLTSALALTYSSTNAANSSIVSAMSMGTITLNTWYHVAVTRSGSTFRLFLNGVNTNSFTSSDALYVPSVPLTIGSSGSFGEYFFGYISNVRIIKGSALYTTSFTPLVASLPVISGTALLACASNRFNDKSAYNFAVTPSGTPSIKKFSPFANAGAYNKLVLGGSTYFNGSSDYLSIQNNTSLQLTGAFAIESWVYFVTAPTTQQVWVSKGESAAAGSWALGTVGSGSGVVKFYYDAAGSVTFNTPLVANTWNSIVLQRDSGNVVSCFVNGAKEVTTATVTTSFTDTGYLRVGTSRGAGTYFNGYVSNLRILNGTIPDRITTVSGLTSSTFEYLIVAGGGGGNGGFMTSYNGGGGGGGFRTGSAVTTQTGVNYVVNVGAGGSLGAAGLPSYISGGGISITSAGGGSSAVNGGAGGSGAGGQGTAGIGSPGNVPATIPSQGNNGGNGTTSNYGQGGGGGGAGAAGVGVTGGTGAASNITGVSTLYAGGGGGNGQWQSIGVSGNGGNGGGGAGGGVGYEGSPGSGGSGFNGGTNTGGGGGGYNGQYTGGIGGSGVVIIRYPGPPRAVGGTITTNVNGTATVHTFTSSGVFTDSITSYTLPTTPLVASSTATSLLLNFTDAAMFDATAQTDIYSTGDASLSPTIVKYNPTSMYFDGTGDGLTVTTQTAEPLGSGNFTVEMWMYPLIAYSTLTAPGLLDARTSGDGSGLVCLGYTGTTLPGGSQVGWRDNNTYVTTGTVTTNAWNHLAVVRNSGVMTMYINGSVTSTATNTTSYTVPFKYIGMSYDGRCLTGYIDDLRITKGIARYTSAFIAPTYKPQLK